MNREQRAKQRYSVEVANAGNYLNIRPSTLETLNKSGQSSIYNRRNRKLNAEVSKCRGIFLKQEIYRNIFFFFVTQSQVTSPEQSKLQSVPEISMTCPPALRCLVYLWEQLCSNCIQIIQSNATDQNKEE